MHFRNRPFGFGDSVGDGRNPNGRQGSEKANFYEKRNKQTLRANIFDNSIHMSININAVLITINFVNIDCVIALFD